MSANTRTAGASQKKLSEKQRRHEYIIRKYNERSVTNRLFK